MTDLIDKIFGKTKVEEKEERRKFIILMDYENLEKGLEETQQEKLRDFSWLIDPILKQGDIVLKWRFIPMSLIRRYGSCQKITGFIA